MALRVEDCAAQGRVIALPRSRRSGEEGQEEDRQRRELGHSFHRRQRKTRMDSRYQRYTGSPFTLSSNQPDRRNVYIQIGRTGPAPGTIKVLCLLAEARALGVVNYWGMVRPR